MSSDSNKDYFFAYEEESASISFSIKLTKMGWDMLSKSERTRLIGMSTDIKEPAKKWNHRQWGSTQQEARVPYMNSVKKWRKKNGK